MIDFYFWGTQCPYNYSNIQVLKEIEEKYQIAVNYIDISDNHDVAAKLNMYSPTLTILDEYIRWTGPITVELLEKYIKGETPKRNPYILKSENKRLDGELKLLVPRRAQDIKKLCCSKNCLNSSEEKGIWLNSIMNKYQINCLGVLHYVDEECVGGVEYVPSLEVPYDIPKSEDTAFLTCIFTSDPVYDYKSYPLEKLEEVLKKAGYKRIYAVVSEKAVFPNGPLDWFLCKGFVDLGLLYYEKNDGAIQHLVEKLL